MILLDIKKYMKQKRVANLQQIAFDFKQPPEAMRAMLAQWVKKGRLALIAEPPGCGSTCTQCKPEYAVEYEWVS